MDREKKIGENLCMEGLENPYLGWYDDEKWLMEEEYRKKEEDPNYKINYS